MVKDWRDLPDESTPILASELKRIETDIESAANAAPGDAALAAFLGSVKLQSGKPEAAVRAYQSARKLGDASADVELGLGDVGLGRAGQHGLRDGAERLGAVARVVGLQADAPLLGRQVVAHLLIELLGAGRRGVGLGADAEHGHGVAHRPEAGQHRAADALGGRIGRAQLGVRGLDGLQLLKQLVVLGVGQLGRVQRVVLVRGAVQGGAQAGGGSFNIHSCSRLLHMGNLLIR